MLGRLAGAKYFTSLDLQMGFEQVPLAKEHRKKSAFVTPDGLFEFKKLPFGLCGAPPTFQRLMDRVLKGLKWTQCLVYMDDILVFGQDINQHNDRLDRVLDAIACAGLTLNIKKCLFGASPVLPILVTKSVPRELVLIRRRSRLSLIFYVLPPSSAYEHSWD